MKIIQVVIGIVTNNNDEILVVRKRTDIQENDKFLHGKWHMPGGKVNDDEDLESAVIREVFEETGMNVEVISLVAIKEELDRGIILNWYSCKTLSDSVVAGSDVSEAKFINKELMFDFCDPTIVDQWPREVRDLFTKS